MDKIATLSSNKRFLIIVALSADRTESFLDALVTLEALKVLQARAMVDVAT